MDLLSLSIVRRICILPLFFLLFFGVVVGIVRGQPPGTIRQLLLHGGLRRLLLQARYLNLETTGGQLRYRQPNVETNVEYVLFLLSLLFDVAEAIERA